MKPKCSYCGRLNRPCVYHPSLQQPFEPPLLQPDRQLAPNYGQQSPQLLNQQCALPQNQNFVSSPTGQAYELSNPNSGHVPNTHYRPNQQMQATRRQSAPWQSQSHLQTVYQHPNLLPNQQSARLLNQNPPQLVEQPLGANNEYNGYDNLVRVVV